MWMRENAPKRMFAKEFSGKYQERTLDTESRDVLRQAESLSAVGKCNKLPSSFQGAD